MKFITIHITDFEGTPHARWAVGLAAYTPVIPAKAGIQSHLYHNASSGKEALDSRLRGNDGKCMQTIHVIVTDYEGARHTLEGIEGWRLMEVIRDYGLPIKAECGGACACATCHVYVAPEWVEKLAAKNADEDMMLDDAMAVQDNSRLSCQIILGPEHEGLEVTLAPNP